METFRGILSLPNGQDMRIITKVINFVSCGLVKIPREKENKTMFYNAEKKYERLFERGSEQFSYAENMEDWKECYDWYRKHKMLKRTAFVDWVAYLLTQSVKYIHQVWEKYCSISMEEIAFNEVIAIA